MENCAKGDKTRRAPSEKALLNMIRLSEVISCGFLL